MVALGGGHGLAATLSALRRVTSNITAVVTVADNGGSSGRLREEFNSLPPGDLRMALSALCADDDWGRSWAEVMQHRFTSKGEMNNHTLGNLLLTALWDSGSDPVSGIERVGELLKIIGRVLPMSLAPLDIEGLFQNDSGKITVRGQVQVATQTGGLLSLRLIPENPPVTPQVLAALREADFITFGPGSWFSSVMPHFLLKEQVQALLESKAKKVIILNLQESKKAGEFAGNSPTEHLKLILSYAPSLLVDYAIADRAIAIPGGSLDELLSKMGGELIIGDFASENGQNHHNIEKLASTFSHIFR